MSKGRRTTRTHADDDSNPPNSGDSGDRSDTQCNWFVVGGMITDRTASDFLNWIMFHNATKAAKSLLVVINSIGGELAAGFAIQTAIESSIIPVNTVGVGDVCSAATLLLIAGKHRSVVRTTSIMCHQFSQDGIGGKYHDLATASKENGRCHQRMSAVYRRYTGLSAKQVDNLLIPPSDMWLTVARAKQLNLVDKIVDKIDFSALHVQNETSRV